MLPSDATTDPVMQNPTDAPTEAPTETPTEAPTEAPTEPPQEQLNAVVNVNSLNIRESAHSSSRRVGRYARGAQVVILEQKMVNGVKWGRTSKGWICLSYVKIGETEPDPTEPPTTPPTQPPTEPPTQPPTDPPKDPSDGGSNNGTLVDNPFVSTDFVKNGHFISCKKEKTAIGIDVSRWQEKIDWNKLKAAGVDYVMIRAGFRGTAWSGKLVEDTFVKQHYEGAKAAGLKVGFYFYSQARTVKEAQEEAKFFMEIVKDFDVDLPLVCDWEYANKSVNPRLYGLSKRRITDCIKAFCETIQAGGYYPMAYLNNYVLNNKVYIKELAAYGLWYADYRNYLNTDFRVDMWQYTDRGRVSGISGNVDLNVIFLENSMFAEIFAEDD